MISERNYMRRNHCATCGTSKAPTSLGRRPGRSDSGATGTTLGVLAIITAVVGAGCLVYWAVITAYAALLVWWMAHWIVHTLVAVALSPFVLGFLLGILSLFCRGSRGGKTVNIFVF